MTPGKAWMLPVLMTLALPGTGPAAAEVYKWVDPDGTTHYSDRPAADNADPVEIKGRPAGDPALEQRRRRQQRLLRVLGEDREQRRQEKEAARREQQRLAERCREARERLKATLEAGFLYEQTGDPDNPRILSTAERQDETERLRTLVERWCD